MDSSKSRLKVLMLPWLAHGHASPYLELSKRLIAKNFFIYFCSTPIILSSMKEKLNEKQLLSIQLVALHLQSELPPHQHTTKTIPNHLIPKLKDAFDLAGPSFSHILETLKPNLVVYDVFQPWAPTVSSSHNIPAVMLSITGASMICLGIHMIKYPEKEFPFKNINSSFYENYGSRGGEILSERREKDATEFIETVNKSCEIIMVRSFEELEGECYDYLSFVAGKRVVSVGPLVVSLGENGVHESDEKIIDWLDQKNEGSTVFVSFGSECFLTKEEIEEVALGLEISNVNFLWVVRFPTGEETKIDDILPPGFLSRVGEKGRMVEGWAPQMKILSHSSIGGFVSQCGWNSMMESLKLGVPIIAAPMHLEQPASARLIAGLGVGIEVERDENRGLERTNIAKAIRRVVAEKDGEGVRAKAKRIGDTMGLKEEEGIDRVVEEFLKLSKR